MQNVVHSVVMNKSEFFFGIADGDSVFCKSFRLTVRTDPLFVTVVAFFVDYSVDVRRTARVEKLFENERRGAIKRKPGELSGQGERNPFVALVRRFCEIADVLRKMPRVRKRVIFNRINIDGVTVFVQLIERSVATLIDFIEKFRAF